MKVLFTRPRFAQDLPWSDLGPALPGWDIDACKPAMPSRGRPASACA